MKNFSNILTLNDSCFTFQIFPEENINLTYTAVSLFLNVKGKIQGYRKLGVKVKALLKVTHSKQLHV